MKVRRNQKICDMPVQGKVLCAKFGTLTHTKFASGDDKNNVQLWKLGKDKPLMTLNSQTNQQAQVEVSAVCFSNSEEELFSGSNRGVVNVWDLQGMKQQMVLKGHVSAVNTICVFPSDNQLIMSGALDMLVKQWDLRQRNQVNQFKGHQSQINCVQVSPDGKMLASASHDGTVKIWDIGNPSRPLNTFIQHDAPVTILRYNPVDKALATGGNDRTIKYWDLDSFSLITSTRPDATPIQNLIFDSNGKFILSAAHESLKAWNLEKDGLLLDNVESSWRGVLDLCIHDEEGQLLGLAAQSQQGFGLWAVHLSQINFDFKNALKQPITRGKTPDQRLASNQNQTQPNYQAQQPVQQPFQSPQMPHPQQGNHQQIKPKPNLASQGRNVLDQPYQPYQPSIQPSLQPNIQQQPFNQPAPLLQPPLLMHPSPVIKQDDYQNRFEPIYRPSSSHQHANSNDIQSAPVIDQFSSRPQQIYIGRQNTFAQPVGPIAPPSVGRAHSETEEDAKLNQDCRMQEEMMISADLMVSNPELNFSQFISGDNKEKFKQHDLLTDINREHPKVMQILKARINHIKPILHWWNSGNLKSAVNAINSISEPTILQDALAMIISSPKYNSLQMDLIPPLLEKAKLLVASKFMAHIKGGLEFMRQTLVNYKDEIISIRSFQANKVDLAREERVQRCDKIIEAYRSILQMQKIQNIIERNKEEVSETARKLQSEILVFIKRVSQ